MPTNILTEVIPTHFLPMTTPWTPKREQVFESLPYTYHVCVTCLGPLDPKQSLGQCRNCMSATRAVLGDRCKNETDAEHVARVAWGLQHLWTVEGYVAPYVLRVLLEAQELILQYASPQARHEAWTDAGIPSTSFWLNEYVIPLYDEWIDLPSFDKKNASVVRRDPGKCGCCGKVSSSMQCSMCERYSKMAKRDPHNPQRLLNALSYFRDKPGNMHGLMAKHIDVVDRMIKIEANFRRNKLDLRDF